MGAAGAGFPVTQDWQESAVDLVELLRLDRAASFVFRISGSSMLDAGLYDDDDIVVVDRDAKSMRLGPKAVRRSAVCQTWPLLNRKILPN